MPNGPIDPLSGPKYVLEGRLVTMAGGPNDVIPDGAIYIDAGVIQAVQADGQPVPAGFADGVDAALWSQPTQKIYFFKGDQYIRVDPNNGWNVDAGYPKSIEGNWPGFPADFALGVDSAIWSETNQRIYFFRGVDYIRVNPANSWNVDGGYPRKVNINWMPFPTA